MAIEITDVTYSYFDEPVLQNVNMLLEEGKAHVILGSNGSGKTTLALTIAGVLTPRTGTVRVDGEDPASKDFDRSRVQLAFQFPEEQMFEVTVEAEIAFGLKNFGMERAEIEERCRWALEAVGLPAEMLGRAPDELSYGEMRKVALASVIALRPAYLLLDEPMAGLDWASRKSVLDCLENLRNEGLTTLVMTHEPDLAAEIGDTVSLIVGGTLSAGPLSTADFFYSADRARDTVTPEYLPAAVRVLRALKPSSFPGRPIRDPAIIDTIFGGVRS